LEQRRKVKAPKIKGEGEGKHFYFPKEGQEFQLIKVGVKKKVRKQNLVRTFKEGIGGT